ncbi:MAG: hypothetical protein KatS3mg108_2984 [Isosphaeraceae bacterium]|jgi:nucleoside-diphosphate-sugar epimerase|nr:MAG: hypothetical protein KatS3mg108_2984 [Isosphaeraceae bacterium]
MSRVLIVGCGYLGLRVARLVLEGGRGVVGTTRSDQRAAALASQGIEPLRLDLLEPRTIDGLPAVDAAVLCVGYDRRSGVRRQDVGVVGLERVARRLAQSGIRRLVYTGSVSVYGTAEGGWVDEATPPEPGDEAGRIQVEAEAVLRAVVPDGVHLRLGGLYGPGRIIHREAVGLGQPLRGQPERWLNLIHVEDAARAVVAALDAERAPPIVNVCDDRPVRRRECVEATARSLGLPPPAWIPETSGTEPNRRVRNRLLRKALVRELLYPTIEEGIPAAIAAERQAPGAGSM